MIDDYKAFIANKIATMRYQKNISSRDLSLDLGFDESYISKLENKKFLCSIEKLSYICDYFGITLSEFFDEGYENPVMTQKLIDATKGLNRSSIEILINLAKEMKKK